MAYLGHASLNFNKAVIDLRLVNGTYYYRSVTATTTVIQDLDIEKMGILKISFIVPADAPNWNEISKQNSYLKVRNDLVGTHFISYSFATLEALGFTSWIQGSEFSFRLVISPIVIF